MGNYCRQTIQHKQEFPVHMWSACLGALFAYFQCTDSVLPNSDGPLSTAVPVSTIRAANREVKPVLHYPARQRGRTLRLPSDATLMGVVNWVTVNQRKFSPRKTIVKQFLKVLTRERNPLYGITCIIELLECG